jgi:hypothetical protein
MGGSYQRLGRRVDERHLTTGVEGRVNNGTGKGVPRFLQGEGFGSARSHGALEVGVEEEEGAVAPLPGVSGTGPEMQVSAYGLSLQGQTDADFRNRFRTAGLRTTRGSGCEGCSEEECVRVRGTLVSTFSVATTVTLPRASDYPELTRCQRQRVQSAISSVLAPHEQQHVREFRRYNGTVNTPFDLTICRSDFESRMQEMHDDIATRRQETVQAASDALDPFYFEVDLECED